MNVASLFPDTADATSIDGPVANDQAGMRFFDPNKIGTIMRTLMALPLVLALAACGSAPGYKARPAELAEVQGVYRMDNGLTLKVYQEQRRLFAQLGQRPPAELVAVAEYSFVAPDQRMTLDYRPIAFGDEIVLTYPSDLKHGSSELVRVRLAAH